MTKEKQKSPFALALAARKGDIDKSSLSGAARLLYQDSSLTQADLKQYSQKRKEVERPEKIPQHRTFKRT